MNKSLKELLLVQLRTFFREPAILFWAVLFPILMAWVLGVAFSEKKESTRLVYVTGDTSSINNEMVVGQETGTITHIRFKRSSEEAAVAAVKKGITALYIEVDKDSTIYHFDPSNAEAQLTYLMIENNKSTTAKIEKLETQGTRYIDFLIPGLIAFGIMNSCLWGISWSLIEYRMKKLLRRMIATPMRKSIFLFSQIFMRIILSLFESLTLFLFAHIYFGTVITGNLAAFFTVYIAGVFAFSGIGILAASRTSKSQVGNGLINVITLPMMILSGIFFNYHNFPEWTLPFIKALPLTILADSLRSIFIEGAGFKEIFIPTIMLASTGLVTFLIGKRIFKWY